MHGTSGQFLKPRCDKACLRSSLGSCDDVDTKFKVPWCSLFYLMKITTTKKTDERGKDTDRESATKRGKDKESEVEKVRKSQREAPAQPADARSTVEERAVVDKMMQFGYVDPKMIFLLSTDSVASGSSYMQKGQGDSRTKKKKERLSIIP